MNIKFINKETLIKEFENFRKENNIVAETDKDEIQMFCAIKSFEIENDLGKSASLDIIKRIENILQKHYNLEVV